MEQEGLDFLTVYGDREHCANLAYLTGFDPRFEEALLLLDRDGRRTLLVGNECLGYLPDERLGCQVVLFQEFSLMGQPRGDSRPLDDILASFGIKRGSRVGCVGWKYYEGGPRGDGRTVCDLPAYLVDSLRRSDGQPASGGQCNGNFHEPCRRPAHHLRARADRSVRVLRNADLRRGAGRAAKPAGRRGRAVARTSVGLRRAAAILPSHDQLWRQGASGLSSPSNNRARLGDPFTVGFGATGSLACRAGCIAGGPGDLPAGERDFFALFAANYFDVACTWYEQVRVAQSAARYITL